ncbi:hypothetical protein B0H17DRAFT_116878 [Mycena rosella]|uniref:Uncharacterized protein n=1 Tax=Mycena rosella TaxID=1033263 RepID=A0AAD7D7C9_MYCRO|nr:hypothetical protein B0H17DRAFT_116878 [Mycena rosella]
MEQATQQVYSLRNDENANSYLQVFSMEPNLNLTVSPDLVRRPLIYFYSGQLFQLLVRPLLPFTIHLDFGYSRVGAEALSAASYVRLENFCFTVFTILCTSALALMIYAIPSNTRQALRRHAFKSCIFVVPPYTYNYATGRSGSTVTATKSLRLAQLPRHPSCLRICHSSRLRLSRTASSSTCPIFSLGHVVPAQLLFPSHAPDIEHSKRAGSGMIQGYLRSKVPGIMERNVSRS